MHPAMLQATNAAVDIWQSLDETLIDHAGSDALSCHRRAHQQASEKRGTARKDHRGGLTPVHAVQSSGLIEGTQPADEHGAADPVT